MWVWTEPGSVKDYQRFSQSGASFLVEYLYPFTDAIGIFA